MKFALALAASLAVATAQRNPWARLDKPALRNNLDDLEAGYQQYLPETSYTLAIWSPGAIPSECRNIAVDDDKNPADFQIYNVKYNDCGDPWVFCYHKDSEVPIQSIASQFGRLPLQMREYVRHVVTIPDTNGHAYMKNANIVFFKPHDNMVSVMVHETGHALDLNGAYNGRLSFSDNWWTKYARDSHVPDNYARSNMVEDVAQAHTVAVFDRWVPGGFRAKEPNYSSIFNHYATVITVAREHGRGGKSIIEDNRGMTCGKRFPPSTPVGTGSTAEVGERAGEDEAGAGEGVPPVVGLQHAEPFGFEPTGLSTKGNCSLSW